MPHTTMTRWQKATALVPLALLSGAWTASLAATGSTAAADQTTLPDGTTVPTDAIQAPASVSLPDAIAPGVPAGSADAIIASASTNGIPSAALAAYQRAAQVINAADTSCNIPWQLIAAIGRVESDHGRYGGNVLSNKGVSTPGIYGIPLDGSNGTAKISDTDAGQFDNDPIYDRAVGPMQFIPSTWSVVGVDADGDGRRNPQDIDDAALATAVYLCSGSEDLSQTPGQRSAVYRYNHSQDYVDLVLSIMQAYMNGDFSSVPNSTAGGVTFYPAPAESVVTGSTSGFKPSRHHSGSTATSGGQSAGGGGSTGGSGSGGGGGTPSAPGTPSTGTDPTDTVKDTTDTVKGTVNDTVTPLEEATAYCKNNLTSAELDAVGGLQACTDAYLKGGKDAVTKLVDSLTGVVGGVTGGLTN